MTVNVIVISDLFLGVYLSCTDHNLDSFLTKFVHHNMIKTHGM